MQKSTSTNLLSIWYVRPVGDSKPLQTLTFDLGCHIGGQGAKKYFSLIQVIFLKVCI